MGVEVDGDFESQNGLSMAADEINAAVIAAGAQLLPTINEYVAASDGLFGPMFYGTDKNITVNDGLVRITVSLTLTRRLPLLELMTNCEAILETTLRAVYEVLRSLGDEPQDDESGCPGCGGDCGGFSVRKITLRTTDLSDLLGNASNGSPADNPFGSIFDKFPYPRH